MYTVCINRPSWTIFIHRGTNTVKEALEGYRLHGLEPGNKLDFCGKCA